MSHEDVEIVRRLYDDLSSGDLAAVEAKLGAGVEWDTQARGSDGALVYGIEGAANTIRGSAPSFRQSPRNSSVPKPK